MIPLFKVSMAGQTRELVDRVLASGMIGEGPRVCEFTRRLAALFQHENVLCLNSCTSALVLALRLSGVGPGDEVISSPFTMISPNTAVLQAGGRVRWSDVDPRTLCSDVKDVRRKLSSRTKAVIITCLGGLIPFDLEQLEGLGVPVILDCAHALSTTYRGRHVSHWADFCCFSFQAVKHLTTGDGGAITVRDDALFERAQRLRWFGIQRTSATAADRLREQMDADVSDWGYKFHMNDIAAAIGLSNFDLALTRVRQTRENTRVYLDAFRRIPEIRLPEVPGECEPSWWVFGMRVKRRDHLMELLQDNGIQSSPLWKRNDHYTVFRQAGGVPLPGMDMIQHEILFIPNGWWVSEPERARIIETIRAFYGRAVP